MQLNQKIFQNQNASKSFGILFSVISLLLILLSSLFETTFISTCFFLLFVSSFFYYVDFVKKYEGTYFVSASLSLLLGILLVYVCWIIPSGFDYYGANEGFDPFRFDYLARHSSQWNYSELGLPGTIVALVNVLYSVFGENIFINGVFLYFLLSIIVLCADNDKLFAKSLPFSLIIFPDALLLFNLPAKEGYTIVAIFAYYVLIYKSKMQNILTRFLLLCIFVYSCIPRPQLVLILIVASLAFRMLTPNKGKLFPLFALTFFLALIFYFFQDERLDTHSEFALMTRFGENTPSIDYTKGAVRDYFATDPRSIWHFILVPVRFIAYIIAPFPTGGVLQILNYRFVTDSLYGFAAPFAMLNRISYFSIIAILITLYIRRKNIGESSFLFFSMFVAGIMFTALYSPFLHQRYRIPFLPLLFLIAITDRFKLSQMMITVVIFSEIVSAAFFLMQN